MLLTDAVNSIEGYLNPDVFNRQDIRETICEHLTAGRLVMVKEALNESFAERMYKCLDEAENWQAHEDYRNQFHYHHHNLYDEKLYPPDLKWCCRIFSSDLTRNFVQRLANRSCEGPTQFSASWYLPGDHSLPHNDRVIIGKNLYRQVAFIWHLSKNWEFNWGGDLFWCPSNQYISASFNTLFLFNVRKDSLHFVTTVSPYARSKRLAINGWWTSQGLPGKTFESRSEKFESGHPLVEVV